MRVDLAQTLNTANTYVWHHLEENNLPILHDDVPKKNVGAIILHKIWSSGLADTDLYVEITVLNQSGDVSTDYCNVLIKKHSVSVWITKSQTNMIVNLLQKRQESNEFQLTNNTRTPFVPPYTQTQDIPIDFQHGQQHLESFNLHSQDPDGLHETQLKKMQITQIIQCLCYLFTCSSFFCLFVFVFFVFVSF